MRLVDVGGASLAVRDEGRGEPVVLVQTGLTADELLPLARHLLDGGYRVVVYHRRGYGASSPVRGRGSVVRDAADCAGLVAALGLGAAHVVGYSYSGAVGLELAGRAGRAVGTLTLVEPPPLHVPSVHEFREAIARLRATRDDRGAEAALDEFLTRVTGPRWRADVEQRLPGAADQMRHDAATFFDTDLPALLDWEYGADDARRITCPTLHVGGSDSGTWFAEVRELIATWLPDGESVVLPGADHSLALTHAPQVGAVVVDFLRRHPLGREPS